MFEWKEYFRKGEEHRKKMENAKPDIVERINEHIRLEKEKERQDNQRKDDWYWTSSDNESEDEDNDYYTILHQKMEGSRRKHQKTETKRKETKRTRKTKRSNCHTNRSSTRKRNVPI